MGSVLKGHVRPRQIRLRLQLAGGHSHTLTLSEDAQELRQLFTTLASPKPSQGFVQLPLDGGKAACTFRLSELVSVVTTPPVVVELQPQPAPRIETPLQPARVAAPHCVVLDDFLSPDEHRDMLAHALACEGQFEPGTVTSDDPGHRQNLVVLGFGASEHSKLIENRLLVWFPLLAQAFGEPVFPLHSVESQLTAGNDGHFFRAHSDSGETGEVSLRALSCVYYFHREPKGFAGGELRLYDAVTEGDRRLPAETFHVVEPVSNRMVVFPSGESHQLMPIRCPSREFADSRFAITTWLRRSTVPDAEEKFGWGHFRCGVVASQFAREVRA